jgi:hypothetical protein
MRDFTLYSDTELRTFVKGANIPELSGKELLHLHYELTQVPTRATMPVPLSLVREIQERGLREKEQPELYGEYAPGK